MKAESVSRSAIELPWWINEERSLYVSTAFAKSVKIMQAALSGLVVTSLRGAAEPL
jgi:hypothetical protein